MAGPDGGQGENIPPRRAVARRGGAGELRRIEAYFLAKMAVYRDEAVEQRAELEERVSRLEEDVAATRLDALVSERQLKARIRELEAKNDFYRKRMSD